MEGAVMVFLKAQLWYVSVACEEIYGKFGIASLWSWVSNLGSFVCEVGLLNIIV